MEERSGEKEGGANRIWRMDPWLPSTRITKRSKKCDRNQMIESEREREGDKPARYI
jgi:hypothetical protein